MDTRKCARCGIEKKLTSFKKHKSFPNRLPTCRHCYDHNHLKENKRTKEQIESQRNKLLGRKYSLDHRLAISQQNRKRVKNGTHNFIKKVDISLKNARSLKESPRAKIEYKIWKEKLLERASNKCEQCGSTNRLHGHHKQCFYKFPDLRYDVDNGMILCISCHMKHHGGNKINIRSYQFKKGQKAPIGAFKKGNIPWNKGGDY